MTTVVGGFRIDPALNSAETSFLRAFGRTRRVRRRRGPYAVHDLHNGYTAGGSAELAADVIDNNQPANGQPGLWCPWQVSEDGKFVRWNEHPVRSALMLNWLQYLIDRFFEGSALNGRDVRRANEQRRFEAFSFDHQLYGMAQIRSEEPGDRWTLSAAGVEVTAYKGALLLDSPSAPTGMRVSSAMAQPTTHGESPVAGRPAADVITG